MLFLEEKYINPFTDFGFKKLFGEEPNKDLLIDFLNELLKHQERKIIEITYLNTTKIGFTHFDRNAIFDIYCESEDGSKFIVEMQKSKQDFFKDRSVFYSTFPIIDQAQKGNWNFELKSVYTIGILDFIFEEDKDEKDKYRYDVKLSDIDSNKIFYDKLTFIYLEMPKFNKSIKQLENRFEKWMYILKNLPKLDRIPFKSKEKIFKKFFEVAEIAKFTKEQARDYQNSLKYYRDIKNSFDSAINTGHKKGIEEGIRLGIEEGMYKEKVSIVKKLYHNKLDLNSISNITELNVNEIKKILKFEK